MSATHHVAEAPRNSNARKALILHVPHSSVCAPETTAEMWRHVIRNLNQVHDLPLRLYVSLNIPLCCAQRRRMGRINGHSKEGLEQLVFTRMSPPRNEHGGLDVYIPERR